MFDFIKAVFKPKADLSQLIQQGAVIVDVRSKAEFGAGHIPGSTNIPLDNLKDEITALKKLSKPLIVVCRSGYRSGVAKSILSAAGIQVHNGGDWAQVKKRIR